MNNKNYSVRVCDTLLQAKLRSSGAVQIQGPKWCGKTWTALNAAKSVLYMQDPDRRASYLNMAETMPSMLLRGDKPRLLDEWQDAKVLWDAVRFAVDQNPQKGQFILTGSVVEDSSDPNNRVAHTGTGRISYMRMRPMSLFESGESNGTVSLRELFEGKTDIESVSALGIESLAFAICRGGWPASVKMKQADALEVARNYVDAICNRDASEVDQTKKDPDRMRNIMRSLSRNISTMATDRTILSDVAANDISLSDKTMEVYLRALRRLFVVEDIKAWLPTLRSKTGIRMSDKRQLVDPSIAVAALEATPAAILEDFKYFGFLFESLCARDLRVYTDCIGGTLRHYHDHLNLEADLIITLNDGRWAAVEVKLGSREIEEGAAHLLKLSERVDTDKVGAPAFLMVLTGGEFAYRRKDGVLVVPIGCLGV